MPTDEPATPRPSLIWIAPTDFPAGAWSEQRMVDDDIPYVPKTEVDAVWEKAIKVAQLSVKKSIVAGLDVAAAEILIRRLENAARESEASNEPNS